MSPSQISVPNNTQHSLIEKYPYLPAGFEPAILEREQPHTYALG